MVLKKQLNMNTASFKNYETGQVESVKGAASRLEWFSYEIASFITTPVQLMYCTVKLFSLMGYSWLIGISLMALCIFIDRRFHELMLEINYDYHKTSEKRSIMITESINNIRLIKQYGWDKFFYEKVVSLKTQEFAIRDHRDNMYMLLEFMWRFLPELMSSVSFIIYISFGNRITLADSMQILLVFGMIRGPFHHI